MSIKIVFATSSAHVGIDGRTYYVIAGTHWPADDPLVKAHPHLFSDDLTVGISSTVPATVVEQASAAPGEKRTTRRGS